MWILEELGEGGSLTELVEGEKSQESGKQGTCSGFTERHMNWIFLGILIVMDQL